MSGQQREEGLPRTPSLLPHLWVDAVGDTVETQAARSSDVQSHSWRREPGSPPECGFREILRGWRSQMFRVTAGGENQEAHPGVWIQRDLEGLEKQLRIKKTQRRVKSTTLH